MIGSSHQLLNYSITFVINHQLRLSSCQELARRDEAPRRPGSKQAKGTSPGSSVPGSVVPRLGSAFSSMISPVALVLDDVHRLHDTECRAALSVLADHVPGGSRLVLAGPDQPPVRLARLRAEGKLMEIGPGDLSLTPAEAAALLRAAEVILGEDEVAELHRRTEGWPVGLYLAALYLREGGTLGQAAAVFGGDDRFVSEYVESELLARLSEQQRAFLTRTAVLERMCGPLCEAVLEFPGSAAMLAELARSNLLLVPLDRRGQWYRYHHLFRDMLLAELGRRAPGLISVLRRRAAAWCQRNDLAEEALEYSIAAGDVDTAARVRGEDGFVCDGRQRRPGADKYLQVHLVCPHEKSGQLVGLLTTDIGVRNVVVLTDGAKRPDGDVTQFDLAAGSRAVHH
jgi:hypothetical protein